MTRQDVPVSCLCMAINLRGLVDILKTMAAFQRHLSRLQKWIGRNLVVLGSKLSTSHQGALAAGKTDSLLGCSQQVKESSYSSLFSIWETTSRAQEILVGT